MYNYYKDYCSSVFAIDCSCFFVQDVPVDEAQVMISIRNIKGVKMPEEVEVSK